MSRKIRVIVVDDSALVRSLLSEIINRQRDMECIGTANDPLVAREMIRELDPDVITLDVEMPRKVVFFPVTGKAMVKRLAHAHPETLVAQEVRGNAATVAKTTSGGSVDLF